VNVLYRQAATDDVIRQFRYYLESEDLPHVAVRFREAVQRTLESLRLHPNIGARYRSTNPHLQNLRSWPVAGFEAIRIYYLLEADTIRIVRVLHGKRDISAILDNRANV
jgi:toxin ParE1/3/4